MRAGFVRFVGRQIYLTEFGLGGLIDSSDDWDSKLLSGGVLSQVEILKQLSFLGCGSTSTNFFVGVLGQLGSSELFSSVKISDTNSGFSWVKGTSFSG